MQDPINKKMSMFLIIATLLLCFVFIFYACQNKGLTKTISEEKVVTDRLLSVANLEQTESGRIVIAWFYETPQVFEFSLGSVKSQQIYKLLEEAKEKQLPVNVRSIAIQDKNIIDLVIPATEAQIKRYKKEKSQRKLPVVTPDLPDR